MPLLRLLIFSAALITFSDCRFHASLLPLKPPFSPFTDDITIAFDIFAGHDLVAISASIMQRCQRLLFDAITAHAMPVSASCLPDSAISADATLPLR